ncbi:ABC transporter permease [Martelella radicis]|uniref:NitT/TauT family transport system permease protein n=1 Tax=Martelella radicis TaxID=1397476 RepID=A0A7W6KQJ0_9HYPH|nr:ABC transporter permease [Martelella radicis]MBB4124133.1 NitT/TauT family transport system permease protein [Martelella radicis]
MEQTSAALGTTGSMTARRASGAWKAVRGFNIRRTLIALILPIAVLVIWQVSGTNGSLFGGVLPTPDRVWKGWQTWAFGASGMGLNPYSGTWWDSLSFSTIRVAQGFALAIVVAIPTGIFIGWSRLAAEAVDPTIQLLRPVPITAWLPFSIAVFGISSFGAIFLIALGAFYPIVINTTQGARNVEKNLVRAARMLGANRRDVLLKVVVPSALPSIFTGLRIGLGIGWTAVIVAEMVAVKSGLGYVLWDAYYVGRMDVVIADMATIGLMGLLSDRIILIIEHRLLAWQAAGGTR